MKIMMMDTAHDKKKENISTSEKSGSKRFHSRNRGKCPGSEDFLRRKITKNYRRWFMKIMTMDST